MAPNDVEPQISGDESLVLSDEFLDNLVTTRQIADKLHVSDRTITKWEAEDGFPTIRLSGRRLYDMREVAEWVKSRRNQVARRTNKALR